MKRDKGFRLQFIVISFLFLIVDNCQSKHDFQHSLCTFHINYMNDSCSNFEFIRCNWKQQRSYLNSQSDDWNTCTKACCNQQQMYSKTSEAIKQCQDYLNTRNNTSQNVLFALYGIFGFISLLTLVSLLIKTKSKKSKGQENVKGSKANQKTWKELDSITLIFENQICSICLEANCFLELECHHVFHSKCILRSFYHKIQCILCRKKDLKTVRIYCQRCLRFYYESPLKSYLYIFKNQKQICQNCNSQTSNM